MPDQSTVPYADPQNLVNRGVHIAGQKLVRSNLSTYSNNRGETQLYESVPVNRLGLRKNNSNDQNNLQATLIPFQKNNSNNNNNDEINPIVFI